MESEYRLSITAEDMARKWVGANFKEDKIVNSLNRKLYIRYYANCFKTLLEEMQSDESCLLYFAGAYFKSTVVHSGDYAYILTNKRIIMAGAFSNMGTMMIPFNAFKSFKKNFSCAKKVLYLNELQDVTMDMIINCDALKFQAGDKSFYVRFYGKNITHKLCKEIHEVLDKLKKQQAIENVNRF